MSIGNSVGFVGFGLVMWVLPVLVPGWFPHTAIDGSSTRALWVELMGMLQLGMGLWFLGHDWAAPALARWLDTPVPEHTAAAGWPSTAIPTPLVAIEVANGTEVARRAGALVATAVFRNHRPQSLVHLVRHDVVDLAELARQAEEKERAAHPQFQPAV